MDGDGLPTADDREVLGVREPTSEHVFDEIANDSDRRDEIRHAIALLRTGNARAAAGDLTGADESLGESVAAFVATDTSLGKEGAAAARITQAITAIRGKRVDEALGIIEQLIEQFGGFPRFTVFSAMLAPGLDTWLWLLEEIGDDQRLYDATGVVIERLGRDGTQLQRLTVAKALVRRARTGRQLGHAGGDAVNMYRDAIVFLEAWDATELAGAVATEIEAGVSAERAAQIEAGIPGLTVEVGAEVASALGGFLAEARLRVAVLLAELERDDEARAAFERIVATYADSKEPQLQSAVTAARMWLEADEEEE
jgi:tetratricopeptide (TPR) repeat protein